MDEKSLSKRVVSGEIVNLPKFQLGDCVQLKGDYLTRHTKIEDREVLAPKGTKGLIVSVETYKQPIYMGRTECYRVRLTNDLSKLGKVFEGDDIDLLERFEADLFDRMWLNVDYESARKAWDEVSEQ